eukprot:CAMPEP_0185020156 /NCGR_PEP_ID=MMETSP1103-20130426/2757_1 /TAXON_ID=36769 /ORGANISM="Paraphysomonas bandaiensis, Strain Caron Lab Isolate" /LENGTH=490 /DNA_ID=CAMNT_0027550885 /DNA_START=215 /DNA_END=1687 /DNA_ORIENTATION=-
MMWITFAPISDDASDYFNGIGTTAVNFLAIVFQIFYGPGTLIGIMSMKRRGLRGTLVLGGWLTFAGATLRVIAAYWKDEIGNVCCYALVLSGQCLAALAQPMFNSLPVSLAAAWFSISERDIATAIASLFNPLGNAVGQVLPPMFVSENDETNHVTGFTSLLLCEALITLVSLVITIVFFQSQPPTPPSYSTQLRNAGIDIYSSIDSGDIEGGWNRLNREFSALMNNKDYVILLVAFSSGLGLFNTFLTLIYQIVEPFGYSNDDAGSFGAVLIVCGLVGAAVAGAMLETTHAYRTILKGGFLLCQLAMLFFFSMLFSHNFYGLLVAFCLLGLFMLPMLPAVVENCAECTYPIPEELSTGLLFVGGNIIGIPCIFIAQYLIGWRSWGPLPFTPSNVFIQAVFLFTLLVLYFYNGEYKRMNCDNVPADEREDTTMFCDYPPECGPLNPAVNCSSSTSNLERTETPNSQLFSGFHGTLDSRDDSDPSRSNETF